MSYFPARVEGMPTEAATWASRVTGLGYGNGICVAIHFKAYLLLSTTCTGAEWIERWRSPDVLPNRAVSTLGGSGWGGCRAVGTNQNNRTLWAAHLVQRENIPWDGRFQRKWKVLEWTKQEFLIFWKISCVKKNGWNRGNRRAEYWIQEWNDKFEDQIEEILQKLAG